MNHVLKNLIEWKSKPMLELVSLIHEHIQAQYKDLKRAIYKQGPYKLSDSYSHYFIQRDVWCSKKPEEKKKIFDKLLSNAKQKPGRSVTSTDKTLTVAVNPSAGKKPGQRKRKINAKTTTVKKTKYN